LFCHLFCGCLFLRANFLVYFAILLIGLLVRRMQSTVVYGGTNRKTHTNPSLKGVERKLPTVICSAALESTQLNTGVERKLPTVICSRTDGKTFRKPNLAPTGLANPRFVDPCLLGLTFDGKLTVGCVSAAQSVKHNPAGYKAKSKNYTEQGTSFSFCVLESYGKIDGFSRYHLVQNPHPTPA
jgi:hypothetical protein